MIDRVALVLIQSLQYAAELRERQQCLSDGRSAGGTRFGQIVDPPRVGRLNAKQRLVIRTELNIQFGNVAAVGALGRSAGGAGWIYRSCVGFQSLNVRIKWI